MYYYIKNIHIFYMDKIHEYLDKYGTNNKDRLNQLSQTLVDKNGFQFKYLVTDDKNIELNDYSKIS